MSACPKCGKETEPTARICPACGVIMSKVRARTGASASAPQPAAPHVARAVPPSILLPPPPRGAARTAPNRPPDPVSLALSEDEPASPFAALLKVGVATGMAVAAWFVLARMQSAPPKTSAVAPVPVSAATSNVPKMPTPDESSRPKANGLTREDVTFLNELSSRLRQSPGATPTEAELDRTERIFSAHQDDAPLKELLMAFYLRRADHDLQLGSFSLVGQTLGKMKSLDDRQPNVYGFETYVKARQSDWAGSLLAAQTYESLSGEATLNMSYSLALALERLGRKPDALTVLDRPIFQTCSSAAEPQEVAACQAAQNMRAALTASNAPPANEPRQREALQVDASKEQIQSERFDIRFDGENQAGVARDVLFVLDRAYVRLADIYYDRPSRKIPVVLHSSQDYFTKTGAPWWSGGVFSSHNGAIQIPIRGLPSTLPREMEDTLVHELSHAFVDEMSGGFAGRELQEGLAQYMEGKRIEQELGAVELKRLANSGRQTVMTFYMLSLVVAQQLVQSRGQGMVNQLLKAAKETHSEDGGFKKTFGQSGADMKKDILETFWRRYS